MNIPDLVRFDECADDFLRAMGGQLVAREAQANKTLHEAFAAGTDHLPSARAIALLLPAHDGDRYVAHVLPLKSLVRNGSGTAVKAVAALFVRRVQLDTGSCGELIARTFELTPTELRVLLGIVEVGGVPGMAAHLDSPDPDSAGPQAAWSAQPRI